MHCGIIDVIKTFESCFLQKEIKDDDDIFKTKIKKKRVVKSTERNLERL